jgi:hypothetical protein
MGGLILLRQKYYGGQVDWWIHGLLDRASLSRAIAPVAVGYWLTAGSRAIELRKIVPFTYVRSGWRKCVWREVIEVEVVAIFGNDKVAEKGSSGRGKTAE